MRGEHRLTRSELALEFSEIFNELDSEDFGELIDKIATIDLQDEARESEDLLGRVYEYFVGKFASAEGKSGGEFYTPQCVVRLLVSMLAPGEGDRI